MSREVRVGVVEGVTGYCRGVSRVVSVAGEVSREVSGGCGGGCDEVLPRGVTGGVGCVWGRCVTRGVGVRKGVGGVTRCRGVSREVSVTGEVSAPADGSHGSVGGGVDGLRAVEPQGGSQWRGADQAQRACPREARAYCSELWVRVFPVGSSTDTLPVDDSRNLVCCRVDEDIAKRKVVMMQCKITGLRWEECRENRLELVQRLDNVFRILGEILVKVAM